MSDHSIYIIGAFNLALVAGLLLWLWLSML
jgi:hypothetical protein